MRSNSKIVRSAIQIHILDSVYDYDGNLFPTFDSAANHLNNEFIRVSDYPLNHQKFPNNQNRFADYLRGIPFHFYFSYEDIKEYLMSLDLNTSIKPSNLSSGDKSEILYMYLIYSEMLKSVNKANK